MSRYFMRETPLADLEKTMMLPPNFRPRGGGISVKRYQYTTADCDCRYCLKAEKEQKPCGEPTGCVCFEERLAAGCWTHGDELNITTLNSLAGEIARLSQNDGQLITLCAVLEAEQPDTIGRALEVTRNLGDYERLGGEIASAGDYGYHVLFTSFPEDWDIDELKAFIDFEKYGELDYWPDIATNAEYQRVTPDQVDAYYTQNEEEIMGSLWLEMPGVFEVITMLAYENNRGLFNMDGPAATDGVEAVAAPTMQM